MIVHRCPYHACMMSSPAPYNEQLWMHIHPECEQMWWADTGPYPRPATITMRGGLVKVLGAPSDSAAPNDDDPELLRSRGVIT